MTVVKKKRKEMRTDNSQPKKKSDLNEAISKLFTAEAPKVSFKFSKGGKLIQYLKHDFLFHSNGRPRSVNEIKNNLFALKHDNGAVSFRI